MGFFYTKYHSSRTLSPLKSILLLRGQQRIRQKPISQPCRSTRICDMNLQGGAGLAVQRNQCRIDKRSDKKFGIFGYIGAAGGRGIDQADA